MVESSGRVSHESADRFLVSIEWIDLFPHCIQVALARPTSDHCPISRIGLGLGSSFSVRKYVAREKGYLDLVPVWMGY